MRRAPAAIVLVLSTACAGPAGEFVPEPSPAVSIAAGRGGRVMDGGQLTSQHVARAEELLVGRFPGVHVFKLPNGNITVRIRNGVATAGGGEPLYVIDGIRIVPGPGGALNGINPEDIAKIEILKDIGSTSFYGLEGVNGVVLITTKR